MSAEKRNQMPVSAGSASGRSPSWSSCSDRLRSWRPCRREAAVEPGDRQGADPLERARLLEQVARARHDGELAVTAQLALRETVELEHLQIGAADDQERRSGDQRLTRVVALGGVFPANHSF